MKFLDDRILLTVKTPHPLTPSPQGEGELPLLEERVRVRPLHRKTGHFIRFFIPDIK